MFKVVLKEDIKSDFARLFNSYKTIIGNLMSDRDLVGGELLSFANDYISVIQPKVSKGQSIPESEAYGLKANISQILKRLEKSNSPKVSQLVKNLSGIYSDLSKLISAKAFIKESKLVIK